MTQARYQPLVDALAAQIRSGDLPPGTRLPTHRRLAEHHGIALVTATRVYAELEAMGLVSGEVGRGTFVREALLPRGLGVDQLYMVGVSTNMCVETTAREAADRGYQVTLVEDACATTFEDLHQVTLRNFQRLFGRVTSTAQACAELKEAA